MDMANKKILRIVIPPLFALAGLVYFKQFFTTTGTAIFFLSLSLALPLSVLYFLQEKILHTWLRFAVWYLPIATVLVLMRPTTSGGLVSLDKEMVTMLTAGTFVALSLVIIGLKYLRLQKGGE
jgi:hypothetical protein